MIHSLFIINNTGDIFMEKHCKSVVHRSICDYFFEVQKQCAKPEDIPAVISTPHNKLILVYRNKLYFLAVVTQ
jgi:AP-3 complex subunit mu